MIVAAAQNVGIGTSIPKARLHVTDSAVLFTGNIIAPPGTATVNPPAQGAGIRMMWLPEMGAFRVGFVDGVQWDRVRIGSLSFAAGYNTTALGKNTVALGNSTVAGGDNSTTLGLGSGAYGSAATAMGAFTIASGANSTALGAYTSASGENATAFGNYSIASGISATAMGAYTKAIANDAIAMGYESIASGSASVAMGVVSRSKAYGGAVLGMYNDSTDAPQSSTASAADRIFQVGNGSENARSNAITILRNGNAGIGNTDPGFRMDVSGRMRIRGGGDLNNSAGLWLNNETNTAIPAFMGMQSNNQVGFYGNSSGWSFVMNTTSGNVGVGTTTPDAKLEINGFTKLGTDAPAIKVLKFTNTTAASQGSQILISHGLNSSKILSVTALVEYTPGHFVPAAYNLNVGLNGGFEFNISISSLDIYIRNSPANSFNIISKPIKIIITYEE